MEALLAEADRRMYAIKQTPPRTTGRHAKHSGAAALRENKCEACGGKLPGTRLALLATVLLGGFLSATLVRLAPGFDADERELDPHLNAQSVQALARRRAARPKHFSVLFFLHEAGRKRRPGNLPRTGATRTHPAARSRAAYAALAGMGLGLAWALTLTLALSAAWLRLSVYDTLTTVVSGTFLCLPAAVLALLSVLWNVPGSLAIALIVFPRTYRYTRNLLVRAYSRPHIITARAKGLGEARILFWHVVPVVTPQLLAVAGVSVSMAVGAAIPVEALCGLAGIGQLAWQAALARDLPLLVNITILVTLVTLLANSGADVIGYMVRGQEA